MEYCKSDDCPMQILIHDCKEDVLRKNMDQCMPSCPEYEIMCWYAAYGCDGKINRRLMIGHLSEDKLRHLEMEVCCILIPFVYADYSICWLCRLMP